jgi:hypothetical protein
MLLYSYLPLDWNEFSYLKMRNEIKILYFRDQKCLKIVVGNRIWKSYLKIAWQTMILFGRELMKRKCRVCRLSFFSSADACSRQILSFTQVKKFPTIYSTVFCDNDDDHVLFSSLVCSILLSHQNPNSIIFSE